jgi:hypothetical protein
MSKEVPKAGTYLRHSETGDLAQIVEIDGKLQIKPDLPGSPVLYPITMLHKWRIEQHAKRLPPGSYARVAYAAYSALCDIHPEMKRATDWQSLHPLKKAAFIECRHKFDHPLQLELFNAIVKLLESNSD